MAERRVVKHHSAARQACDSCRVRKIRCAFESISQARCRGCTDVDIPCTFDTPVKRRGPPLRSLSAAHAQRKSLPRSAAPAADAETSRAFLVSAEASIESIRDNQAHRQYAQNINLPHSALLSPPRPVSTQPPSSYLRSEPDPPHWSSPPSQNHPTDVICPRPLFDLIIQDYLDLLYVLVPIVHRPTFKTDLANHREADDPYFLALLSAICATVVATIPRKFYQYQSASPPLPFRTRLEMVNHCHSVVVNARHLQFYDNPMHITWATSYLLFVSYFHLGTCLGRIYMLGAEHSIQSQMLKFHDLQCYIGLDPIETQLKKKAFWLSAFGYICQEFESNTTMPMPTIYDRKTMDSIDFKQMLPLEIDDEFITATGIRFQPLDFPSTTIGFNANCRIFWAAITPSELRFLPEPGTNALEAKCALWKTRLASISHALDDIHPKLSQWNPSSPSESPLSIIDSQWESMRANVHVGRLWLQAMIAELVASFSSSSSSDPKYCAMWPEREDICRQLLHVLYNISQVNLEPNGNVLVMKIRTVATTLLEIPTEEQGVIARRAVGYITRFTELLARLDSSESVGTVYGIAAGGPAFHEPMEQHSSINVVQGGWNDLDDYARIGFEEFVISGATVASGS